MMRLKEVDLLSLQTRYMQSDLTTQAFCAALSPIWRSLGAQAEKAQILSRISELSGEMLDELAWQYHVDAYDTGAGDLEKRRMILLAPEIHKYKGTVFAVEEQLGAVFGAKGRIFEWWEYGGRPYHFKVEVDCVDRGAGASDIKRAEQLVMSAKNLRSVLDGIQLILIGEAKAAIAAASIQSEMVTVYPKGG